MKATKNNAVLQSGFSLLEIMVVVVIVALLSTLVAGTLPARDESTLIAGRVHGLMQWASERATSHDEVIGIRIAQTRIEAARLIRDARGLPAGWQTIREGRLRTTLSWSPELAVRLAPDRVGEAYPDRPQILMLPDGEITPFTMIFGDTTQAWQIRSEGTYPLELSRPEAGG